MLTRSLLQIVGEKNAEQHTLAAAHTRPLREPLGGQFSQHGPEENDTMVVKPGSMPLLGVLLPSTTTYPAAL